MSFKYKVKVTCPHLCALMKIVTFLNYFNLNCNILINYNNNTN